MRKIIITEKVDQDGINFLKGQNFEVDVKLGLSEDHLLNIISAYDAIIVRSVTQINTSLLEKGTNLKVVGRAGNGVDNIDVDACTKKGIVVVNTPESNTMAAAELAVGLAFCTFRNIPQANAGSKSNDFRRSKFMGVELEGKTAGIVGLGRIGSIVARKLKGCGMNVVAYDPYITDERFERLGVARCSILEDLLKQADLITVHTPKLRETYGMIGEKELQICKKGVRLINAARGGIINEEALYNALKSGIVAAAGIDVLEPEPSYDKAPNEHTYHNKLLELDNVIVTPHLGASTVEANYNVSTMVTSLVADVLNGKIVAAVNMPSVNGRDLEELRPYLTLAEILGQIYYQAETETVNKIEVIYSGDLAQRETGIITLSAIRGFLDPIAKDKINYINASLVLQSMGVELIESKSSLLDKYTNLITIKFYTKTKTLSVSGTVFAKEELRIIDFFGYRLDFEPTPYVIAVQNDDKPGVIGNIGTALGTNNINIAAMQWSRNRHDGKAVGFVSVDNEVSDTVIKNLKTTDGVLKVSMIKFR